MKTSENAWVKEFPGALTVCDAQGIILEMNDKAVEAFKDDGGLALIGKNVLDCHPEPARSQLERMMDERKSHIYTIEKHGVKKLIYQTPWYADGEYAGFMEMSLEVPFEMPHFLRD
jgi:transcriptional regulator with PAS, ATPase and Fis domain